MKRIISILFLFVFLFNVCGYYFFFSISLNEIRKEAKLKYKKEHLEILEIDVNDKSLVWLKADEIEYKGNIYDIFEKENKDGKLLMTVFNDKKEAKLRNYLDKHIADFITGNSDGKQDSKDFSKKVNILYVQNIAPEIPVNCFQNSIIYFKEEQSFLSFFRTVPVPPPDLA